jgi:hypothetical protein
MLKYSLTLPHRYLAVDPVDPVDPVNPVDPRILTPN